MEKPELELGQLAPLISRAGVGPVSCLKQAFVELELMKPRAWPLAPVLVLSIPSLPFKSQEPEREALKPCECLRDGLLGGEGALF